MVGVFEGGNSGLGKRGGFVGDATLELAADFLDTLADVDVLQVHIFFIRCAGSLGIIAPISVIRHRAQRDPVRDHMLEYPIILVSILIYNDIRYIPQRHNHLVIKTHPLP